ncbi:diiron oxygenase [Planotetraspora sp. GP83]|uniref:diiron oxygenase n=1 Tax=Planotetraspora sp. GP83 TaxID=3156264 RepID=UPI003513DC6D
MTISIEDTEPGIGPSTLRRLVAAWPKRATIRTDMNKVANPDEPYDPELLDYPIRLMPFGQHPDYLAASEEQRMQVNTLAWLAYNERVIAAEEYVANPTFEMLAHGVFPGVDRYEAKEAVQQSHIDEVWHTYMHMIAMQRTREARQVTAEPGGYSHPVTNRRLYALEAETSERWERDLLYLLWTAVGEISVNAFLDLMARDKTVQPMHALVARLHARDEAAHGPVMLEVMREVYPHLNKEQKELFIRALPASIIAFGAEDYELWPQILEFAGIPKAREIIEDCQSAPGNELLVTDFSGVHRLVRELEIEHLVEFDFSTNQITA